MKASEFAGETGISVDVQRDMRRRGLFPFGTKNEAGHFEYTLTDVNQALNAVCLRKYLGMSLEKAVHFSSQGRTHQILLAALGDYQLK